MIDLLIEAGLALLPCECVVAADIHPQDGIVECSWCGTTFDLLEYRAWIVGMIDHPMFLLPGPRSLLRCDGKIHELAGIHHGHPMVKVGNEMQCVKSFEWVSN